MLRSLLSCKFPMFAPGLSSDFPMLCWIGCRHLFAGSCLSISGVVRNSRCDCFIHDEQVLVFDTFSLNALMGIPYSRHPTPSTQVFEGLGTDTASPWTLSQFLIDAVGCCQSSLFQIQPTAYFMQIPFESPYPFRPLSDTTGTLPLTAFSSHSWTTVVVHLD